MESAWKGTSTCTAYGALRPTCNIKGWAPSSRATGSSVHSGQHMQGEHSKITGGPKNEVGYLA